MSKPRILANSHKKGDDILAFFDRVLSLCKEFGTSPSAVAREIGLNNSSATYWKRGSIPKGDTLQKLASYFDTTVDYLLCRTDDPENSDRFGLNPQELWKAHPEDRFPDDEVWIEDIPLTDEDSDILEQPCNHHTRITVALDKLNDAGVEKAADMVELIAEIPRYRRPEAAQPIRRETESKDTPEQGPPPEAAKNGE